VPLKPVSSPAPRVRLPWLVVGLSVLLAAIGATPTLSSSASAVTGMVALALLAALTLDWQTRCATAHHDPRPVRIAFRARNERTAFLPQRDPDASGKPRPRAPGH
jgi:Family of unknown function (DUF6412)